MNIKTVDYEVDENEYIFNETLKCLYQRFGKNLSDDVKKNIEQAIKSMEDNINKDHIKNVDIVDSNLIERMIYNMDTK